MPSQTTAEQGVAKLHILNINKARDTLETQGAPDTLRTVKVLGRPKDSKGFKKNKKKIQKNPKNSKHFQKIPKL